ncbi:MAG TPA: hypothetical protein VGJ70_04070 [Solirubrobacteraceae bacterium]
MQQPGGDERPEVGGAQPDDCFTGVRDERPRERSCDRQQRGAGKRRARETSDVLSFGTRAAVSACRFQSGTTSSPVRRQQPLVCDVL